MKAHETSLKVALKALIKEKMTGTKLFITLRNELIEIYECAENEKAADFWKNKKYEINR